MKIFLLFSFVFCCYVNTVFAKDASQEAYTEISCGKLPALIKLSDIEGVSLFETWRVDGESVCTLDVSLRGRSTVVTCSTRTEMAKEYHRIKDILLQKGKK